MFSFFSNFFRGPTKEDEINRIIEEKIKQESVGGKPVRILLLGMRKVPQSLLIFTNLIFQVQVSLVKARS
jgi:hypothetical protein